MKMNLIIDGNYILYKNVYTLVKMKTLYGDLPQALINNFRKYTEMATWNQQFFVSDGSASWRKQFYDQYKATRKKDKTIDFDFAFQVYKEFKEHMENKCCVLEANGVEGDDWINVVTRKSNSLGIGCMIVSADKDMNQRLKYKLDPLYMNVQVEDYTTYEKIFLPQGFELFLDKMRTADERDHDLFNLPDISRCEYMLDSLINRLQVKAIDPVESLFIKLVCGDKGDNVKSIFETPQNLKDGGTRMIGVGEATGQKMWVKYQEKFDNHVVSLDTGSSDFSDAVIEALINVKSLELTKMERDNVRDKLAFNARMMELHHKHLPKEIMSSIATKLKTAF